MKSTFSGHPCRSFCDFPESRAFASLRPARQLEARQEGGFSLIEVCLAIGIVAFAFIPIIGMIPVGLNTFRNSIDTSVGSQIVQRVTDDLQQTDFPSVVALSSTTRYFDTLGNEVPKGTAPQIYDVQVYISGTTALPGFVQAADTASNGSTNLATLSIYIANNPGHITWSPTTPNGLAMKYYSSLIAGNPAQQ